MEKNMTELLSQGCELMAIGMGVVFVFLILLVSVTSLMSTLVHRYLLAPEAPSQAPTAAAAAVVSTQTREVIAEAIRQHRARYGNSQR